MGIHFKIQLISIFISLFFLFVIGRLIVKGKLREEYSIIWLICTSLLVIFSLWRNGLEYIAELLDVSYSPALFFLGAILMIFTFLVHLSIVNSKQHKQIKELTQELALLKNKIDQNKD